MSSQSNQPSNVLGRLVAEAVRIHAKDINVVESEAGDWTAHFALIGGHLAGPDLSLSRADASELEREAGPMVHKPGASAKVRPMPRDGSRGPYEPGNRRLEIKLYPVECPPLGDLNASPAICGALGTSAADIEQTFSGTTRHENGVSLTDEAIANLARLGYRDEQIEEIRRIVASPSGTIKLRHSSNAFAHSAEDLTP